MRVRWESKVLECGANSIFWGLLSKWGVKRYLRGVYRTSIIFNLIKMRVLYGNKMFENKKDKISL